MANKHARDLLIALGFISASIAATHRVMKGRHFLSGTVFAVMFVALLAVLLARVLFLQRDVSSPKITLPTNAKST